MDDNHWNIHSRPSTKLGFLKKLGEKWRHLSLLDKTTLKVYEDIHTANKLAFFQQTIIRRKGIPIRTATKIIQNSFLRQSGLS